MNTLVRKTKSTLESLVTVVLVTCALVTTGVVVRREFLVPVPQSIQAKRESSFLHEWRDHLAKGVRLGGADAPVQLIEFADFECPFCGSFHRTLKTLRERYPTEVSLTFVHFPLPMHRFAEPAARVATCAGDQDRFEAMQDQLFKHQDDFGLKPWREFATAAGVPDLTAFDHCVKRTDALPRVAEGKALGKKLDIQGTPTIVINGWKLGRPPTVDELDGMVKAILAGKSPVTTDGEFVH